MFNVNSSLFLLLEAVGNYKLVRSNIRSKTKTVIKWSLKLKTIYKSRQCKKKTNKKTVVIIHYVQHTEMIWGLMWVAVVYIYKDRSIILTKDGIRQLSGNEPPSFQSRLYPIINLMVGYKKTALAEPRICNTHLCVM